MGTEEDTFNRLRRVPYAEAFTEYTIVFMQYEVQAGTVWCNEWADVILKPLGWSIKDLEEYSEKLNVSIIGSLHQ
jgi:hypothetical protein